MSERKIIGKYKGVNIISSCGYYYPSVNTNIECTSIREVKRWIREVWSEIPDWVVEGFRFLNYM